MAHRAPGETEEQLTFSIRLMFSSKPFRLYSSRWVHLMGKCVIATYVSSSTRRRLRRSALGGRRM